MNLIDAKAISSDTGKVKLKLYNQEFTFSSNEEFELKNSDVILGIRPEFVFISEDGNLTGSVYSTLPAGMETTIKIAVGDSIISSVMFGSIDYSVDSSVNFSIEGNKIVLIDKKSGNTIALGKLTK